MGPTHPPGSQGESQPGEGEDDSDSDGNKQRVDTDLQFITIAHPSEIYNRDNQRCVRSNAIRSQRPKQRHSFSVPLRRSPLVPLQPRRVAQRQAHAATGAQAAGGNIQRYEVAQDPLYGLIIPRPRSSDEIKAKDGQYTLTSHRSEGSLLPSHFRNYRENPSGILGAGRTDPFITSPINHYPYIDEFIDHFANVVIPSHLPVARHVNPLITKLIPFGRDHAVLFHGILTVAGAHLTISQGGQVPSSREMYHRGETYRLLNKMISDPKQATSDVVVAAILNVSGYDVLFGQHDAHEMHMQGLDRIFKLRGPLKKVGLEGALERQLSWSNHFRALRKTSSQPVVSLEGDTSSSVDSPYLDADVAIITPGLRELADRANISRALMDSIISMRSLASTVELGSAANIAEHEINDFHDQRSKVEIQLDSLRVQLKGSIRGPVEECICLTTIIFDHTAMRHMPLASFTMTDLTKQLKVALKNTDTTHCWESNYKALIWVCCIANIATLNPSDKLRCAEMLQHIISFVQPTLDWVAILGILNEFLWCHDYEAAMVEMWSLSQNLREKRVSI